MYRSMLFLFGVVLLAALAPVQADSLTGADRIVCATTMVVVCWEEGICEEVSTIDARVPQFIEIDLKQKRLSTTKASGENRSTPILNLVREGGEIVLQGYEGGRAFSFVISEETGRAAVAVARSSRSVAVFGACTPAPAAP